MKYLVGIILMVTMVLIAGCTSYKIADIKNENLVGKTVTVSGTVQNTIKIGSLSGYTVKDETDTIAVSSESLPKEGTEITVKGVVMKDTIFGYYVKANE